MRIAKRNVANEFLEDLGIDMEHVVKVVLVFEPAAIPEAHVTRFVLLEENRREVIKEKYELVWKGSDYEIQENEDNT